MLGAPEFYRVVIGLDDIEVRHGLEAPLDPAVYIKIILLGIVLQKGGPEKVPGEVYLDAGIDQEQLVRSIGLWKLQIVLFEINGEITPGLGSVFYPKSILHPGSIVEGAIGKATRKTK